MEVETAPVARMEEELEVVGSVVSYNRGAGFLQFSLDGADEVCLFRPNKLVVDGQKVPAGKIKTFEGLSKVISLLLISFVYIKIIFKKNNSIELNKQPKIQTNRHVFTL